MPTVSVLIATYNGSRFIARTLESVYAQIDRPEEVIVVDDGSADGTADLVESAFPAATLIRLERNAGAANAYNTAAAAAKGDVLAFLDHDDLWEPGYIARQRRAMIETTKQWACTDVMVRVSDGRSGTVRHPRFDTPAAFVRALLNFDNIVSTMSAVVVRTPVFERVGGLDPAYRTMFDMDLYHKIGRRFQGFVSRDVLCTKNQHASNLFAADGFRLWQQDATLFLDRFFADPANKEFAELEPASRAKLAERYQSLRRLTIPQAG